MSKPNKVNKDQYVQRGRLTPDELARERARQIHVAGAQRRFSEPAELRDRGHAYYSDRRYIVCRSIAVRPAMSSPVARRHTASARGSANWL